MAVAASAQAQTRDDGDAHTHKNSVMQLKHHRRLGLKERGHFSSYPILFPVQSILLGAEEISITRKSKTRTYKYSDLSMEIEEGYYWKAYGAGAGAYIKRYLVTLRNGNDRYRFDLSRQFSDFSDAPELMENLKENINLSIKRVTKKEAANRNRNFGLLLVVVFVLGLLLI